ncbi:uncharacterized protein HaLaN_32450, partial [Haematococcus lacustris]
LQARNVMLCSSSSSDPRGLVAKVGDCGLSISMAPTDMVKPGGQHAMFKAADVYAFGVTLYEMFTGTAPFQGLSAATLRFKVGRGLRPSLPPMTPAGFRTLAQDCWQRDQAS